MVDRRTLRGMIDATERRQLVVDDGDFENAWRVTAFYILPVNMTSGAADASGVLALDRDGLQDNWRLDDNRQIGWSSSTMSTAYALNNFNGFIDPGHIVVRDLWVTGNTNSPDGRLNFMIEIERVRISADQAVLAILKERSQDDPE